MGEAHAALNGEEGRLLAAEEQAARVVAHVVDHIQQLAFVRQQAVVVAFLPEGGRGEGGIARIRATPNGRILRERGGGGLHEKGNSGLHCRLLVGLHC